MAEFALDKVEIHRVSPLVEAMVVGSESAAYFDAVNLSFPSA
jgi:hypothetical protein